MYADVITVMSDEQMRNQILHKAKKELIIWKNRYKEYGELVEVFKAIEKLEKQLIL